MSIETILIVSFAALVIYGLLYANFESMQSDEFKEIDDNNGEIWDRWP